MSTMPDAMSAAQLYVRPLAELADAVDRFSELERSAGTPASGFHAVAAAVHTLCTRIGAAEAAGVDRDTLRMVLAPAWEIHGQSPFIRRLQTWPRGYPGDFETIEYLLDQEIRACPDSLGYWLEFLALQSPIAQQHRNKVHAQAREIVTAVQRSSTGHPARILVLAAGSGPDLALVQEEIGRTDCAIVLNDSDAQALEFSQARLAGIRDRLLPMAGNALKSIPRLRALGPFDLVLAGGLFDYLPERHAIFLIRAVCNELLADGGRLFLTNIASPNPYRVWIEYLADWHLIERSAEELRWLAAAAAGSEVTCGLRREGSGMTWLMTIDKVSGRQGEPGCDSDVESIGRDDECGPC